MSINDILSKSIILELNDNDSFLSTKSNCNIKKYKKRTYGETFGPFNREEFTKKCLNKPSENKLNLTKEKNKNIFSKEKEKNDTFINNKKNNEYFSLGIKSFENKLSCQIYLLSKTIKKEHGTDKRKISYKKNIFNYKNNFQALPLPSFSYTNFKKSDKKLIRAKSPILYTNIRAIERQKSHKNNYHKSLKNYFSK